MPVRVLASVCFAHADGRNFAVVFVLITSLFLLWGFCNGMIDILNKHFQDALHINKEQSGLVQASNYLALLPDGHPGRFDRKKDLAIKAAFWLAFH